MKKGWQTKTLGEAFTTATGNTPPKSNAQFFGEFMPLVKPPELCDDKLDSAEDGLSKSGVAVARTLPPNSILVSCIGNLGKIGLNTVPVAFNQQINAILPDETKAMPEFMFYQVLSSGFKEQLEAMASGTTVPIVNKSKFNSIQIVLAPLPEQQRIVGILDKAFEGIATAKANAEKNLQNARALFDSHLQSVFSQRGKGWVEMTFAELVESNVIGLTKNSREQSENKAWPYVKMNNITRDNRFSFASFTCVDATDEDVRKFALRDGDFLFNTRNSYELVGKSCIYESDSNDAVLYNNNIMRVRFKSGIDARFVLLAFSSKSVADKLTSMKSGTTNVSAIYYKDLKALAIPVPPIAEQKTIAAKLESLTDETQRLAAIYQSKFFALEALKKSLLHQAFSGDL